MCNTYYNYKNNIKVDLKVIGWRGMGWINLVQDRNQFGILVNAVRNLLVA
jgi:hypothetical protein